MSVFTIIICCIIVAMVFIMAAPFALTSRFSNLPNNRNGILEFSWIHPWIALIRYDLGKRALELRLFGWKWVLSDLQSGGEEKVDERDSPGGPEKEYSASPSESMGGTASSKKATAGPLPRNNQGSQSPPARSGRQEEPSGESGSSSVPNRFTWPRLKKTIAVLRRGHCGRKLFRWSVRLVRLSLAIIRFDHLRLYAKAGVEDPAETGKYYGYFTALHGALLSGRKNIDVRLEPHFMSNVLEFEGSVGIRSSIAAVVMPIFVALVTFPYITVFFVWRRLKKVYTISVSGAKA